MFALEKCEDKHHDVNKCYFYLDYFSIFQIFFEQVLALQ